MVFIRAPNNCLTFFSKACLLAEPTSLGVDVFFGDNLIGFDAEDPDDPVGDVRNLWFEDLEGLKKEKR